MKTEHNHCSREKWLSVNVLDKYKRAKVRLLPESQNISVISDEQPLFKKQKVHLVASLLGKSQEAKAMVSRYKKIIRILPKEFDI